jgi:hypothetical protein
MYVWGMENNNLVSTINKDIISLLINIIDDSTGAFYLQATDRYYLINSCECSAIAINYELKILNQVFIIKQINFEFIGEGLTDTPIPEETRFGVKNPYSAMLNVYVKKHAVH